MAITLVQSNEGVSALATTSPSFSGSPASGNLVVLCFASDDYNGTPDAGWTQSTGMEQQVFHGGYLWWRISAGANPPGAYTIGTATVSAWILMEFSGLSATPYDISNGQSINGTASSYTTPSIIPTSGSRLLVAMLGASDSTDLSGVTITGWTNSLTSIRDSGTSAGATDDFVGTAWRLVTGDGVTGFSTGGTYTGTTDVESRSGLIIAFKEAAGDTFLGQACL